MEKKLNNLAIRAAGALFIATMYTTSIVCGNYARYVTADNADDSARTAAFGVFVTGSGELFGETYYDVNGGISVEPEKSNEPAGKSDGSSPAEAGISVKSMAQYGVGNVVAPGTKNSEGVTISVTGVPEVDVRIEYGMPDIEDIYLKMPHDSNSNVTGTYPDFTDSAATKGFYFDGIYYPLEFTLRGKVLDTNRSSISTLNVEGSGDEAHITGALVEIAAAVKELNEKSDITYKAGTNLAEEVGGLTLTWEWKNVEENGTTNRIKDFQKNTATTDINGYEGTNLIDKMDTLLGDFATWTYSGDGKVTVEDIMSTKCGFVTAMETFDGEYTIRTRAGDSEIIFRGLFGKEAAGGGKECPPLWFWLNAAGRLFNGDIYTMVSGATDNDKRPLDDYYNTYVKVTTVPADPDPTNAKYWTEVSVNLSVTVTQVD